MMMPATRISGGIFLLRSLLAIHGYLSTTQKESTAASQIAFHYLTFSDFQYKTVTLSYR